MAQSELPDGASTLVKNFGNSPEGLNKFRTLDFLKTLCPTIMPSGWFLTIWALGYILLNYILVLGAGVEW